MIVKLNLVVSRKPQISIWQDKIRFLLIWQDKHKETRVCLLASLFWQDRRCFHFASFFFFGLALLFKICCCLYSVFVVHWKLFLCSDTLDIFVFFSSIINIIDIKLDKSYFFGFSSSFVWKIFSIFTFVCFKKERQ